MATADDRPDEASAWLDGLAGRAAPPAVAGGSADDAAHAEGQRLRDALLGGADVRTPAAGTGNADEQWQQLLQRAQPTQAANEPLVGGAREPDTMSTPAGAASGLTGSEAEAARRPATAAAQNTRSWGGRAWVAAAGIATLALVLNLLPPAKDDPTGPPAMRGGGGTAEATWLSSNPAQDVEQLLGALNAAGAQTTVQTTAAGLELRIQAAPAARDAVNALLSRFDTALGHDGVLTLRVAPAASAPR
jgi:hypothetical protein